MGNVNDDLALVTQLLDDAEQAFDFRVRQRSGRLVESDHLHVFTAVSLHDLDHLLIGNAQILDLIGGLHVQTELINDGLCLFMQFLGLDCTEQTGGQTTQENVFTNGKLQHDLPFLVDDTDTSSHCFTGIIEVAGFAIDQVLAAGLLIVTIQDLQQSGLTCTILAHQSKYFTAVGNEADVIQSFDAGEVFGNVAELNHICHSLLPF